MIPNKKNTRVSVCILTKNPGPIFKPVLQSVLAQEVDFEYEVIIVDSGSTDGTLDFINTLVSDNIRLLTVQPRDFGHGKTRNYAISETTGEFVVMLTHDAKPKNNHWLNNIILPFFSDEKIAGVFGRHDAYENASLFTKRDLNLHFDNFKNSEQVVYLADKERYACDLGYQQWLHYFSDNNAALRRSVWEQYPYPNVDFAEDQLWAKEIIQQGFKKAYADDAVVYHSHNYTLAQTFRRSYDESRALKRLFNYNLCPSILNIMYQISACSIRDLRYFKEKNKKIGLKALVIIIAGHCLKQSGFYLGNKFPNNKFVFRLVSLDNSIKGNS